MARKKVPASSGTYSVVIEVPGPQEWAEGIHGAFDEWTLDMAENGLSEAVVVLPAFEVVDETDDEPAMFKLSFVNVFADSAWLAVEDCVEKLAFLAPDFLANETALRVGAGAEEVIGLEVEIDVPDS